MARQDLLKVASELERKINQADSARRLALQPEFTRVLQQLTARGQEVAPHMRQLNTVLCDEAVEAWFDNMPV